VLLGYVATATLLPAAASAQWIETGREPTVCPTPFKPISGITFRGWTGFKVTWTTARGQFGAATYLGLPNPVVSDDATKIWENPTAFVTCEIIWYASARGAEAVFDWHVVSYGGEIRNCATSGTRPTGEVDGGSIDDPAFDPYLTADAYDGSCDPPLEGGGGGSWPGPDGTTCTYMYVYIDVSYDGGRTWKVYWEGWATVCG
jgi:hypothetical protein